MKDLNDLINDISRKTGSKAIGIYVYGLENQEESFSSCEEWESQIEEYKSNNWRLSGTTYWGEEHDVRKVAKALSDISVKYKIVYLDKNSLRDVEGVHFDIGNWSHPITNMTVSQLII